MTDRETRGEGDAEQVLITGNTYPVREGLKALGGQWDAEQKGWWVPIEQEGEAKRLLRHSTDGYRSPFKYERDAQ